MEEKGGLMLGIACTGTPGVVICPYIDDMEGSVMPEQVRSAIFRSEFLRLCARAGYNRQDELASIIGVSSQTISNISSGKTAPALDLYFKLLDLLGNDLAALMRTSPAVEKLSERHKAKKTQEKSGDI